MLESLLPETQDILGRAERLTGKRIEISPLEEAYLSSSNASSQPLSDPQGGLLIAYNPQSENQQYAVAHEAARILRFARAPPGKRFALISGKRHRERAFRQLYKELKNVREGYRVYTGQLLGVLYQGILTQLASTSADLWINKWLLDNYPSFQAEVESGLDEIFEKAHSSLGKDLEGMAPATIYRATNALNAAHADFLEEELGMDSYMKPYRGTEFESLGGRLREVSMTDRGHYGDKLATGRWAKQLGMQGWFGWKKG